MTEKPILFSAPMVRALLDGSKTQTRRIMKPQPVAIPSEPGKHWWPSNAAQSMIRIEDSFQKYPSIFDDACPHGGPGSQLWGRETWYCDHFEVQKGPYLEVPKARELLVYRADNERPYEAEQPAWRPSIHMPRWASRILLEIVSVRVERLEDCSDADARAEGTPGGHGIIPSYNYNATPSEHFMHLWESINGVGSWAANPWVWVIEFKRVTS
ncbi:hypothetical protein GCN74_03390 [Janthinobacterium sp. FT14W]|uniref:hypothetical protein n=1 Tax=Janthinobacterium sp. FT14W TaxID=2654253 RepID=UPI0012658CFC|nr:hypothetical protein [Janthinobacterium sp. FT14W]KAB8062085.1 hypothetical protein GCN74_03390 [Janthinobacterium sp. FT14W]